MNDSRLVTGRLNAELLIRLVEYGSRCLHLVETLESDRRSMRVVNQLAGSGPGAAAQLFEASEALSRRDFIKILGIAAKEFSETQYWLRVIESRSWVPSDRLAGLIQETAELLKITKSLIARSKTSG